MPKLLSKEAVTMLACLERRNAEIRELEHQLETEQAAVRVRDGQISDLSMQLKEWKKMADERLNKLAQLQAIIATMDTKAIETVKSQRDNIIQARDLKIVELSAELQRCLGWIDALIGKHPTRQVRVDLRDGRIFDRAVMGSINERSRDEEEEPRF